MQIAHNYNQSANILNNSITSIDLVYFSMITPSHPASNAPFDTKIHLYANASAGCGNNCFASSLRLLLIFHVSVTSPTCQEVS